MAQSAHNRYALGVDIGGSHICSAVVDLATGQLCGEPHTDKVDAAAGARTIAGAWAANIRRTAAASGIGRIRCAGFAFPGPFDYERGISLIRGVRKFERIYGLDCRGDALPAAAGVRHGGVPLRQRRGGLRAGRMPRRGRGRRRTRSGADARHGRRVGLRGRPQAGDLGRRGARQRLGILPAVRRGHRR